MIEKIVKKYAVNRLRKNLNRTAIELCINNKMELYDHFSVLKESDYYCAGKINREIVDYLINGTDTIPRKNALTVSVRAPENSSCDIALVEKLIKDAARDKMLAARKKIKKETRNSVVLAFFGMLLIGLTQIFHFLDQRISFHEFIIVMSWVFMWKAVELWFFERTKLIKENRTLMKIHYAEVIRCTMDENSFSSAAERRREE